MTVLNCSEITPLLSAYNDGELPALQTDQVTQHLDNCQSCKETLLDFVLLGHHLRGAVAMPSLDGFADGVMAAIGGSRRPLPARLLGWVDALRERWVAAVSLAGAAVAVASLVLVLVQPRALIEFSGLVRKPASMPANSLEVTQNQTAPPGLPAPPEEEATAPSNSETYISRLEARHPSVATWSEPDNKTTVIWLGDDNSPND